MTAETTTPPQISPEERLRGRALDLLRTHALEVILASDGPLRTVDVARLVAERLPIQLNEEEMGGLASLVRMVLDSDPLFSQANRQWDLALRMGRAEGDRRKPVERAIEDFIDLLGHPATPQPVATLTASVYGRTPDYYRSMIERLVGTRPQFFSAGDDRIAITRWLIDITAEEPEYVEEDNFSDPAVLNQLRSLAERTQGEDAASFARAMVLAAGAPVDGRALLYYCWRAFPDTEPEQLFLSLLDDESLVLERGPAWTPREDFLQVVESIRGLASDPEGATELVAAAVPAEDGEIGILAPTTVRVSDEDLNQIAEFVSREPRTYRVAELCQQVLEAFPGSRTYSAVHDSLFARMKDDARFIWVGFERFRPAGSIPMEVQELPEGLAFDERSYLGPEGEEVDRLIDPREWKAGLEEQIMDYLVQDVADDSTEPAATPTKLVSSPPLHHYVAGTRYLRHSDTGFFPTSPSLVQVTLNVADGNRFDVWVNNGLSLVFGLKEWYDASLPWVGGEFTLERGEQPDEYRLVYSGEVNPLMDIPMERLSTLLQLRGEADAESLPLSEVVQRLLKAHPEGVHFVTLFTELNVVRRVRRAQLASVLTSQRFFTQSATQAGFWMFDEKRAQKPKGKKKGAPKRPMREMYDEDEDEDFEIE